MPNYQNCLTFLCHIRYTLVMEDTAASMVRNARIKAGLTQKQLSERAGMPQPQISKIESGKRPLVSWANIQKLLDACRQ